MEHNFLLNKKILNLHLRWHILRSYCFLAEVTVKKSYLVLTLLFPEHSFSTAWKHQNTLRFSLLFTHVYIIQKGSTLKIQKGSKLKIQKGSTLKTQKGSTLKIQKGSKFKTQKGFQT